MKLLRRIERISQLREYAKMRGGCCLSSSSFKNFKAKVKWCCKEGHVWDASPLVVVSRRKWCEECAKMEKEGLEVVYSGTHGR